MGVAPAVAVGVLAIKPNSDWSTGLSVLVQRHDLLLVGLLIRQHPIHLKVLVTLDGVQILERGR